MDQERIPEDLELPALEASRAVGERGVWGTAAQPERRAFPNKRGSSFSVFTEGTSVLEESSSSE